MATGASTTSSCGGGISACGPKIVTGTPDSRPPAATTAAPLSAPFASSAITATARLFVEVGGRLGDDRLALVVATRAAHAVRQLLLVALRALVRAGRGDLVRRAPLVRARVRLLLLWDGNGGSQSSGGGMEDCGDTTAGGPVLSDAQFAALMVEVHEAI